MYDKEELVQIRKIVVQRQIRQRKNEIQALEELLDRLNGGETTKEIML